MTMEMLKHKPPEQAVKPKDDFTKYLDERFVTGTSQKLKGLLRKEMVSLMNTKPDNIGNPDLHLALRTAENSIIYGTDGIIDDHNRQKALDASKKKVEEVLTSDKELHLATKWAAAHLKLGGKRFWSEHEHKLMEESLGENVESLLKDSGNLQADEDKRYVEAAGLAATYKLLFNKKCWSTEQNEQMLRTTEKEFDQFNSEKGYPSNNTVPLSSRAATIRILGDFS